MAVAYDQRSVDSTRRTYRLTFPSTLTSEQVVSWITSIGGTLRKRQSRLGGLPTIVFELWADDSGLTHRMKVPWQYADYVVAELRTHLPGVTATLEDVLPSHDWDSAIEAGLTQPDNPLRIPNPAQVATTILASVSGLGADESVLMQWVVTPARTRRPAEAPSKPRITEVGWLKFQQPTPDRDAVAEQRKKSLEANVVGVLRIAAKASTPGRAGALVANVKHALASTHNYGNQFRKRIVTSRQLHDRLERAAGVLTFPARLSASELAGLVAWPAGAPLIAGLPQSRTRHMPVMATVASEGLVIGTSNMPGRERPIAVSWEHALTHVHVAGPTGVGKTSLLTNLAAQTMAAGHGLVVVETKGDLFEALLARIPKERLDDVIVWDLDDTEYPVGFNVLDQGNTRAAVDELNALLASIYPEGGVITPQVMYHGLHALAAASGGTIVDLPTILTPQSPEEGLWREQLVDAIKNPDIRKFWQRYLSSNPREQDRESAPLHRRLWQFATRPEVRSSLGQSRSSFQMRDVVANHKILLVNINGTRIGPQTAGIVGTLVMNALWSAVRTTAHDRPVYLYMDEFQNFVKLPTSPEDMLAQSRSFGLGMVLAHQHIGQMRPELRDAVLANARTKIIFQSGAADARTMAAEFGAHVKPDDFVNLGRFEAIARIATTDGVSPPLTLTTNRVVGATSNPRNVRMVSRARYGRPIADVEAEIERRRQPAPMQRRPRPTIGVEDWSENDDR